MNNEQKTRSSVVAGVETVFGLVDFASSYVLGKNKRIPGTIRTGTVEQFNVGLYSARVSSAEGHFNCSIGSYNVTPGLGYSDATILREGDEVIFAIINDDNVDGIILARNPALNSVDETHSIEVKSETDLERRTSFFTNDCYRMKAPSYKNPLDNQFDGSTVRYTSNRPTDTVPGDICTLNQHKCGMLGGMYSMSMFGGGAHIRMLSLDNRIRIVADSIIRYTMSGNENDWHNRRYLSKESSVCMYQEERLGMRSKDENAFEKTESYHDELYYTKNKKKKQTLRPRLVTQEGYYAGMSAKYGIQPNKTDDVRTNDASVIDPGVLRESIDPSGQYRLAATGMLGFERIGRIPVPIRIQKPWHRDATEPEPEALTEFKHTEGKPFYRQLEHADRVAYDMKNSYSRVDEAKTEFYVPEEQDITGDSAPKDVYDQGFTDSTTVRVEKYDKRRSGIWQGEDGSIILRDAWGSEIVMLGGNIQLSCAGNIEILPGKSSLIMAGDDAIVKAQNSVDIESADKDVRVNAYKNLQIMAGTGDDNPGGVTIESKGKSGPWDIESADGGESARTMGIFLKADSGNIVTDTKNIVLKADKNLSIVAGEEDIIGGSGQILVSAHAIYSYGDQIVSAAGDPLGSTADGASMILSRSSAVLSGKSAILAGGKSAAVTKGAKFFVPLTMADIGSDIHSEIEEALNKLKRALTEEEKVAQGYTEDRLEKMYFRFRSSKECSTDSSWEIEGPADFTLYQPFWNQIKDKFETLKGTVSDKDFDDHKDSWDEKTGNPWPGTEAVSNGKYAKLSDGPVNIDSDGFNVQRTSVKDYSMVTEVAIFPGYKVRN